MQYLDFNDVPLPTWDVDHGYPVICMVYHTGGTIGTVNASLPY